MSFEGGATLGKLRWVCPYCGRHHPTGWSPGLNKRRKWNENQHLLLSASWLWMRCDQLSPAPATKPSSRWRTVSSDCELDRSPFFQLPSWGVRHSNRKSDRHSSRPADTQPPLEGPSNAASQALLMALGVDPSSPQKTPPAPSRMGGCKTSAYSSHFN